MQLLGACVGCIATCTDDNNLSSYLASMHLYLPFLTYNLMVLHLIYGVLRWWIWVFGKLVAHFCKWLNLIYVYLTAWLLMRWRNLLLSMKFKSYQIRFCECWTSRVSPMILMIHGTCTFMMVVRCCEKYLCYECIDVTKMYWLASAFAD